MRRLHTTSPRAGRPLIHEVTDQSLPCFFFPFPFFPLLFLLFFPLIVSFFNLPFLYSALGGHGINVTNEVHVIDMRHRGRGIVQVDLRVDGWRFRIPGRFDSTYTYISTYMYIYIYIY